MTQQNQPKRMIRNLLSSKIFLFLAFFALIFLVVNLFKESYQKYQLNKEIDNLKSEIDRLEGKSNQLSSMIDYFGDQSYLEKQARLKLNLKKPGESVVVISEAEQIKDEAQVNLEKVRQDILPEKEVANYWRWWEYFFAEK